MRRSNWLPRKPAPDRRNTATLRTWLESAKSIRRHYAMRKLAMIGLSLTCVLAISGCRSGGGAVPQTCPVLAEPDRALMQPPTTEAKVRAELFEPQPSATPKSEGFNLW